MARREGGKDTGARGGEECKEDQGLHVRGTNAGGTEAGREGECRGGGCMGEQGDGCRRDQRGWIKGGQGQTEGMNAGGKKGINSRED